jgi:hypothetical protein
MSVIASPAASQADIVLGSQLDGAGDGSYQESFTLRRTGRKAVRFHGRQLVEAAGPKTERDVWHDLNIYATTEEHIVVELIVRRNPMDRQDIHCVKTFNNLSEAASWLQCYDPTDHAPIPLSFGVVDTALPWAVMQAVHLRQTIDRICIDYRSLLTEVFMALDLTEPVEISGSPNGQS